MQERHLRPQDAATFPRPRASSDGDGPDRFVEALVSGDDQAFAILVDQESSRVFRACYRVLGRVDEAEDATQEAFVLAYRALGSYRGDGHPAAWLMRIATREAWRRAAARAKRAAITSPIDEVLVGGLVSDAPAPERTIIDLQDRERIRATVAELKEPYREIITLRFFGELSIREIAAATDRPVGTVKAQIHRGLGRLREMMEDGRR